jgi:Domain of unknown function (DUF4386)
VVEPKRWNNGGHIGAQGEKVNDFPRLQRMAGWSGVVLTVATVLNVITLFWSAKDNTGALFVDPTPLLLIGSSGANWFHWSMVFDLVAYLCFIPIAVFAYRWFRAQRPNLVLLYTIGGVSYSLIGSLGAMLLGVVIPTLAREYPAATPNQQEAMQVMIKVFYGMVVRGLWNPLEIFLLGIWCLGIGALLRRERAALGLLTLLIGGFAMVDTVGWITQVELIFRIGVFGISLLIVWGTSFGSSVLRRPVGVEHI